MAYEPFYCAGCGKKIGPEEYLNYEEKCADCYSFERLVLKAKKKSTTSTEETTE